MTGVPINTIDDDEAPLELLVQDTQRALNFWQGGLLATGGTLVPNKSYWYLVEVIYKNGKWTYATQQDRPGQLHLQNGSHVVTRCEVHQSKEALGMKTRPDGSMRDQRNFLRHKVVEWCDAIRTKKLQGSEAWYCLTVTIMKTIECCLVATSFDRSDFQVILKPLFKTALRLCGIQRNLPRKLLFGPLAA